MTIIDTKQNKSHENVSKAEASRIIGVHRKTIRRWELSRQKDGTFLEVFNQFQIYFNVKSYKQPKGLNFNR
jgi:DNA-binding XRE family transcriptional regulator